MKIIAKQNDTLDDVVYRHTGDSLLTEIIIKNNKNLINKTFLKAGDVVFIPDVLPPKKTTETIKLWN